MVLQQHYKKGLCSGSLIIPENHLLEEKGRELRRIYHDMDVCNALEAVNVLKEDPKRIYINAADKVCNLPNENTVHKTELPPDRDEPFEVCGIYCGGPNCPASRDFMIEQSEWVKRNCDHVAYLEGGLAGFREKNVPLTSACYDKLSE